LISQSGNAYMEGFTPFWDILFAHANDRAANEDGVREKFTPETTYWQYIHGVPPIDSTGSHPKLAARSTRPGPQRQRRRATSAVLGLPVQPRRLPRVPGILPHPSTASAGHLGKNDEIFGAAGAEAFRRDFPNGEIHLLDAGHFALETHGDEISEYIRDFMRRALAVRGGSLT
jgi:pimeloyl-ACP methyl ester carboxylesterase